MIQPMVTSRRADKFKALALWITHIALALLLVLAAFVLVPLVVAALLY